MAKSRFIFIATVLMALAFISWPGKGLAQPEIKIAHLDDAGYEVMFYALKQGIIKSPKVKLKFQALPVPGLIQAMSSKQFDLIGTASIAVPKAVKRGLKVKIVSLGSITKEESYGIFVKKASDIKSVKDLKGRKLGIHSLGAANVVQMKIVLQKKFGLNTSRVGGDLNFVEAPPLMLATLLARGGVDAIFGFGVGFYKASRHPDFRLLIKTAEEYKKLTGMLTPVEAYIAFEDSIARNPEAIREVQRLFFESKKYYTAHGLEIVKEVAAKQKQDYNYLKWWFEKGWGSPFSLEKKWVDALDRYYQLAYEIGDLSYRPNTEKLIWKGYWEKAGR